MKNVLLLNIAVLFLAGSSFAQERFDQPYGRISSQDSPETRKRLLEP